MPEPADPPDRSGKRSVNPAGFVYGVLVIGTVIAAESTRRETYAKLMAASVVTLALYWLAHAYSHHLGSRLAEARQWSLVELTRSLAHESTIMAGAVLPVLALAGAWAAGATVEAGVTAELWTAGLMLVGLEVGVALRSRLGVRDLLIQAGIGVSMGLGILAIRVLLH